VKLKKDIDKWIDGKTMAQIVKRYGKVHKALNGKWAKLGVDVDVKRALHEELFVLLGHIAYQHKMNEGPLPGEDPELDGLRAEWEKEMQERKALRDRVVELVTGPFSEQLMPHELKHIIGYIEQRNTGLKWLKVKALSNYD
jgi:hypothetical protein